MKVTGNNNGFTLIEMLIVLSIMSVMCLIPFGFVTNKEKDVTLATFCEQLEYDLFYVQQLAISRGVQGELFFNVNNNEYYIRDVTEFTYQTIRKYNPEINIQNGTMGTYSIIYDHKGNIRKFGTMIVTYKDKKVKLTFQIGRGRFYFEEI